MRYTDLKSERKMCIIEFFHKIKIGFIRKAEPSVPYISLAKMYGNDGEKSTVERLKTLLPECRIKQNVIVESVDGNAEIDCLVLYRNKLFAIEIKNWKGTLIETNDGFRQEKIDHYTGERHIKPQKSPFKQLERAIFLLKKQIPINVWVNGIVFFAGGEIESVRADSDKVYFDNADELVEYIKLDGGMSIGASAAKFFEKCVPADSLYGNYSYKSVRGIIDDESLTFNADVGRITKKQIVSVQVEHHWSFDRIFIELTDGLTCVAEEENHKLKVVENGKVCEYALCKLDRIEVGR